MSIPKPADMLAELRAGVTDPAKIAVVEAIALDMVKLSTAALAGQNVAAEVAVVKATLANLAAAEAARVQSIIADWLNKVMVAVIRAALGAAA